MGRDERCCDKNAPNFPQRYLDNIVKIDGTKF